MGLLECYLQSTGSQRPLAGDRSNRGNEFHMNRQAAYTCLRIVPNADDRPLAADPNHTNWCIASLLPTYRNDLRIPGQRPNGAPRERSFGESTPLISAERDAILSRNLTRCQSGRCRPSRAQAQAAASRGSFFLP